MKGKNQEIKQQTVNIVQQFVKEYVDLCNKYNLRICSCNNGELSIELNYLDDYFENFLEEVRHFKNKILGDMK